MRHLRNSGATTHKFLYCSKLLEVINRTMADFKNSFSGMLRMICDILSYFFYFLCFAIVPEVQVAPGSKISGFALFFVTVIPVSMHAYIETDWQIFCSIMHFCFYMNVFSSASTPERCGEGVDCCLALANCVSCCGIFSCNPNKDDRENIAYESGLTVALFLRVLVTILSIIMIDSLVKLKEYLTDKQEEASDDVTNDLIERMKKHNDVVITFLTFSMIFGISSMYFGVQWYNRFRRDDSNTVYVSN